ncbi:inosine monophosphate dehydrogenase [Dacryopinax primogenitus]|uniref:Inosine monophosphate dehydrogenase n=1 Tax=Dacryopinax primogenitus (strain DJM 731) TaxID=1858805 RepID=M5GCI4_DACPD|nr:inosine monophosphate dehydrogenase [Dacryopinax primogenitus]EJU03902.1 inosine monophosphate dehydrogenase [Dacryopinax primogenitus]
MHISTPFTRLLSLRTPLILAPMNFTSSPSLTISSSQAGAFPIWALDPRLPFPEFLAQLSLVRSRLAPGTGTGTGNPTSPFQVGVAALGWMLDSPSPIKKMLEHCILSPPGVAAVWLSFGLNLEAQVARIRALDAERSDGRRTLVFLQVGTLQQALEAAAWGVEVLVAQGNEAGGHSWASAPSTSALVGHILAALPGEAGRGRPYVLAAGGVGDGKQVAAYLTLGAEGVVVGTLLAAAEESLFPEENKAALVAAQSGEEALRTQLWDKVQGRPWPEGVTGGALRNKLLDDEGEGVGLEELRRRTREEEGRRIVWAGQGVGGVKAVRPAKEIIDQLQRETVVALQKVGTLLEDDHDSEEQAKL